MIALCTEGCIAERFIIVSAECEERVRRGAPNPSTAPLQLAFWLALTYESHEFYAKCKSVLGPIEIVRPPVSGYFRATALTSSSVIRLYCSAISAGVLNAWSFNH